MCKLSWIVCVFVVIQLICLIAGQSMDHLNDVSGPEAAAGLPKYSDRGGMHAYDRNKGRGWMEQAKDAIAGPAGQMMVHFAKEMISRSAGNSQVNIKDILGNVC